jgi:DNA-binding NarL/FixJ family response regulator
MSVMKRESVRKPAEPATPDRITVALVEDKPELRESWSRLINSFPEFACVCVCSSGEEALRTIPTVRPQAVLMDIFLPRMSGIECTGRLKASLPETQVVILTGVDDDELVFMALEAGADGYLLKRTKPADLQAALRDVLSGGAPMTSEIARRVVESFRRPGKSRSQPAVRLSAREEEVLILLSKGYANKEIADHMSLSVETVGSHLKHIYEKMHVRSRVEAVTRYITTRP